MAVVALFQGPAIPVWSLAPDEKSTERLLVLADRVTVRWAKELAARPVERAARWAGKDQEFREFVRTLLGLEGRS